MSCEECKVYEERFAAAREAWDELAPAVSGISYNAATTKMLEALSGVRLVQPDEADMQWAKEVAAKCEKTD